MQNESPLQRLTRISLGGREPADWIRSQRVEGRTWQDIATDLGDRIGSDVSRETVRLWAAEPEAVES